MSAAPSRSASSATTGTASTPSNSSSSRVSVACRLRPPQDSSYLAKGDYAIDLKEQLVSVKNPKHGAAYVDNTTDTHRFQVNNILPPSVEQEEVFNNTVKDLADNVLLNGISCTLLAYGQTGSGKTHSMVGPPGNFQQRGIIPRAIEYMCRRVEQIRSEAIMAGGTSEESDRQLTLRCSYLEIYNDTLIDLLSANPDFDAAAAANADDDVAGGATGLSSPSRSNDLRDRSGKPKNTFGSVLTDSVAMRERNANPPAPSLAVHEDKRGRVHVRGLSCPVIHTEAEAFNLLFAGEANRAIAEHALNKASTRSHCIFTLYVEQKMPADGPNNYRSGGGRTTRAASSSSSGVGPDGSDDNVALAADGRTPADQVQVPQVPLVTVISKLHLVDLAGSERVFKSESEGALRREAGHINKSLSFLEQVVIALLDKSRDHVPFRSSKLTHILKEAFFRGKTRLLACIWPDPAFLDESISTLRFATRMMHVKTALTRDVVTGALSDAERARIIAAYEGEIALLRTELALHDALAGRTQGIKYSPLDSHELSTLQRTIRAFVDDDDPEETPSLPTVRHYKEAMRMIKTIARQLQSSLADAIVAGSGSGGIGTNQNAAMAMQQQQHQQQLAMTAQMQLQMKGQAPAASMSSFNAPPSSPMAAQSATAAAMPPSSPYYNNNAAAQQQASSPTQMGGAVGSPIAATGFGQDTLRSLMPVGAQGTGNGFTSAHLQQQQPPSVSFALPPSQQPQPMTSPAALMLDEAARTAELVRWRQPGGAGSRLYVDYTEAKGNLKERKTKYSVQAALVNECKKTIDELMIALSNADKRPEGYPGKEQEKEAALSKLSAAKAQYRSRFEELQETKSEVDYLQRVTDQLANRIAMEFQKHWVAKCEGGEGRGTSPLPGSMTTTPMMETAMPPPAAVMRSSGNFSSAVAVNAGAPSVAVAPKGFFSGNNAASGGAAAVPSLGTGAPLPLPVPTTKSSPSAGGKSGGVFSAFSFFGNKQQQAQAQAAPAATAAMAPDGPSRVTSGGTDFSANSDGFSGTAPAPASVARDSTFSDGGGAAGGINSYRGISVGSGAFSSGPTSGSASRAVSPGASSSVSNNGGPVPVPAAEAPPAPATATAMSRDSRKSLGAASAKSGSSLGGGLAKLVYEVSSTNAANAQKGSMSGSPSRVTSAGGNGSSSSSTSQAKSPSANSRSSSPVNADKKSSSGGPHEHKSYDHSSKTLLKEQGLPVTTVKPLSPAAKTALNFFTKNKSMKAMASSSAASTASSSSSSAAPAGPAATTEKQDGDKPSRKPSARSTSRRSKGGGGDSGRSGSDGEGSGSERGSRSGRSSRSGSGSGGSRRSSRSGSRGSSRSGGSEGSGSHGSGSNDDDEGERSHDSANSSGTGTAS
jgi:kinesin family member 6/9